MREMVYLLKFLTLLCKEDSVSRTQVVLHPRSAGVHLGLGRLGVTEFVLGVFFMGRRAPNGGPFLDPLSKLVKLVKLDPILSWNIWCSSLLHYLIRFSKILLFTTFCLLSLSLEFTLLYVCKTIYILFIIIRSKCNQLHTLCCKMFVLVLLKNNMFGGTAFVH